MLHNEARELLVQGYEATHDAKGIAKAYSVSKWTVYRLAEQKRKTGSVALRTNQRGRKPVLTAEDKENIRQCFPFPSSLPAATAPTTAQQPEAKERNRSRRGSMSKGEMDTYRGLIRENIGYDDFVREHPYDAAQLDEMVELMVETVCSKKKNIRVAGNDFPQAVVKSRLLKLDGEHIRFVFDCLRENTTQVRNMKQYLLTVLYNAPATIENHYAAQVNHDLYGGEAA